MDSQGIEPWTFSKQGGMHVICKRDVIPLHHKPFLLLLFWRGDFLLRLLRLFVFVKEGGEVMEVVKL